MSVIGIENFRTPQEHSNQTELKGAPCDSISVLKFVPHSDRHLVASSWDGTIRLFDIKMDEVQYIHQADDPILGCTLMEPTRAFFGGLDNIVSMVDFTTGKVTTLGVHEDAIRCMDYSEIYGPGIIISGSWDQSVKLWDPRKLDHIGCYDQPEQVYCVSALDEIMIVATAENHIAVWDLRKMNRPLVERISEMSNYQSRSLSIFSDKKRYALGSIEGRVSVESISSSKRGSNFVFRTHVSKVRNEDSVYHPVNAISCHGDNCFVTGGSEGKVMMWDANRKKVIRTYSTYPTGIAALDFSENGNILAIGCSYLHDRVFSPDSAQENRIFIRNTKPQGNHDEESSELFFNSSA